MSSRHFSWPLAFSEKISAVGCNAFNLRFSPGIAVPFGKEPFAKRLFDREGAENAIRFF